jgi:hypothetical protein
MRTLHMLHALECAPQKFGSTVRNGSKWADSLGQTLELCVCTGTLASPIHTVEGHAIVTSIWTGKFSEVPAKFIEFEHEIASRSWTGLFASMRRAYGDSFTQDNEVTVVIYFRVD